MTIPIPARAARALGGVLAALAAAALLAACGSNTNTAGTTAGGTATTSAENKPLTTGGTTASPLPGGPGSGKPPVTLGDKNFTEENILGQLYAQALEGEGYRVTIKDNIGSSEITYKALTSGQIDLYPEYTGVLLSAIAGQTKEPTSGAAAYEEAKAFVEKHGLTLLRQTPFYDTNALATLPAYASAHKLATIEDLKSLGHAVKLGGPPEFATRQEGLPGIKKAYGVNPTFVPIAIELSYRALESGQVNVQNVFTTDGQLLSGKFTVLSDPKHVFGFQNVVPLVKQSVLSAEGPAFAETLNRVSALLTTKAMQQMNAAVSIDKQSPVEVAKQFLSANSVK